MLYLTLRKCLKTIKYCFYLNKKQSVIVRYEAISMLYREVLLVRMSFVEIASYLTMTIVFLNGV